LTTQAGLVTEPNTKFKFLFFLSTLILIFILKTSIIHAATLFLSPPATEIKIGETFNVELRINSEGQAFNAAQSTIEFPLDILEVESLDYSPAMSTFNFWLEEPTFSNQEGKITFKPSSSFVAETHPERVAMKEKKPEEEKKEKKKIVVKKEIKSKEEEEKEALLKV